MRRSTTPLVRCGINRIARACGNFLFCLFLLLLFAWPGDASAQRSLEFERFDSELIVHRSGGLSITERIRVHFEGEWNGIYRRIPVEYDGPGGTNYTLRLAVQAVTNEAGDPLKYELGREGRYHVLKVWVPNARDATHTVHIKYLVRNGLRFFDEHDELYWNVTGDESEYPIAHSTARVLLPAGVSGVRTNAFTGPRGSTASNARVRQEGLEVVYELTRPLGIREGFTVVAGWNRGLIDRPNVAELAASTLASNWLLGIPPIVLVLMFMVWNRRGRDPKRLAIAPRYEPPEDLSPAEIGTLVDNTPDLRDITATFVDLAVRGYLTIEEVKDEKLFGLLKSRTYRFHLRRQPVEWGELRPHEVAVLNGIFDDGSTTVVDDSDLRNSFYKRLPGIRDAIFDRLIERGHYRTRPDRVRARWIVVAVVSAFAISGGGAWINESLLGQTGDIAVFAGLLSALIIGIFAFIMPARTHRGARTLERALGFEEFMERVEADRMERLIRTPELFEKYLPYAMALNVDRNWARAFEGVYTSPPDWYRGGTGSHFSPSTFATDLDRMTTQTGAAMASAPRSSSGGSGFSGGSSGGGFGGGGVGGF